MRKKTSEILEKLPDISDLVTIVFLDAKIGEVANKIPSPSVLLNKTDYNAKISDFTKKCFYYV